MDAVKANSTVAVRDKNATCVLGWVELGTRTSNQIRCQTVQTRKFLKFMRIAASSLPPQKIDNKTPPHHSPVAAVLLLLVCPTCGSKLFP